jgi:hypothetical protein
MCQSFIEGGLPPPRDIDEAGDLVQAIGFFRVSLM